jgi:hypothetical protein
MHADSLAVLQGMLFLKTRPFGNNTEFIYVSSFTALCMCSTHFTPSYRILLLPCAPTTIISSLYNLKSPQSLHGGSYLGKRLLYFHCFPVFPLCLQFMHHGSYLFAQVFCPSTLTPLCHQYCLTHHSNQHTILSYFPWIVCPKFQATLPWNHGFINWQFLFWAVNWNKFLYKMLIHGPNFE